MSKLADFQNCSTKGDYIEFCKKYYHDYIKDIDTAIPIEVQKELTLNGVEGFWVTIYYTKECNEVVRVTDILSLATYILKDSQ